jgi:hypothetical protein
MRPVALLLLTLLSACTGDDGQDGQDAPLPATPDELDPQDDAPRVAITILGVGGASGANGTFRVGDRLSVRFTARKDDGSDWRPEELDTDRVLMSGPTFNYQRVLEQLGSRFARKAS